MVRAAFLLGIVVIAVVVMWPLIQALQTVSAK